MGPARPMAHGQATTTTETNTSTGMNEDSEFPEADRYTYQKREDAIATESTTGTNQSAKVSAAF